MLAYLLACVIDVLRSIPLSSETMLSVFVTGSNVSRAQLATYIAAEECRVFGPDVPAWRYAVAVLRNFFKPLRGQRDTAMDWCANDWWSHFDKAERLSIAAFQTVDFSVVPEDWWTRLSPVDKIRIASDYQL